MINFRNVGQHGAAWQKAALVFMNVLASNFSPAESASRRQEAVVRVRYGKRTGVAAVVCICAVRCGGGGFLGEANQNRSIEIGVVWLSGGVRVDSFKCLPKNLQGKVPRRSPSCVRNAVWAWSGVVGDSDGLLKVLFARGPIPGGYLARWLVVVSNFEPSLHVVRVVCLVREWGTPVVSEEVRHVAGVRGDIAQV